MNNKQHNIKRKINKIYREKGRFPTEQEMNTILSYSSEQTKNYMKALEEDGTVIRKGDWYTFPEKGVEDLSLDKIQELVETEKGPTIIGMPSNVKDELDKTLKSKEQSFPEPLQEKLEQTKTLLEEIDEEMDKLEAEKIPEPIEHALLYEPSESMPPSESKPEYYQDLNNIPEGKKENIKTKVKNKWLQLKEQTKPKKKKGRKTVFKQTKEDLALAMYIIRGVMLFVGIGSIAISIYYNIQLSLQFLPGIFAIIGGCIFVLFAVISFETIIYFFIYHMAVWKKVIAIGGFIFLWVIVTLFSMSAVLSGRYHRFMLNEKTQSSSNVTINAGKLRWENIQEQKKDVEQRIIEKQRQLEQLYKISEGISDLESRKENEEIFKNTQWRISIVERDIKNLTVKLDIIRKAELKQLEENPETTDADVKAGNNDNFYIWLSGIFGTTKDKIHFFISLLPAIFFDIISSIAISVFLFLRK